MATERQVEAVFRRVNEVFYEPSCADGPSLGVLDAFDAPQRAQRRAGRTATVNRASSVDYDPKVGGKRSGRAARAPALEPLQSQVVVDAAVGERKHRWRGV